MAGRKKTTKDERVERFDTKLVGEEIDLFWEVMDLAGFITDNRRVKRIGARMMIVKGLRAERKRLLALQASNGR